ncbi:hypothetical protein [Methylocapsa palsarum]|uniref:Cysteine rich repeat-containing protein n=1 Tax=Methylocapsa palsarum TaxID=1612308 RepID=A0A1I3VZW8_9HYPH|nr:hypothetical protein [Methylocapsa palsarum]SFJ99897.1 hypothetical protein SAMN05444581_101184 [Methylocapsa palsarum]
MKRAVTAVLASLLMTSGALCASYQKEQAACQDDAMRLCGPYIPDHGKIHACLVTYKANISPACRAVVAPSSSHASKHHHHHKS